MHRLITIQTPRLIVQTNLLDLLRFLHVLLQGRADAFSPLLESQMICIHVHAYAIAMFARRHDKPAWTCSLGSVRKYFMGCSNRPMVGIPKQGKTRTQDSMNRHMPHLSERCGRHHIYGDIAVHRLHVQVPSSKRSCKDIVSTSHTLAACLQT